VHSSNITVAGVIQMLSSPAKVWAVSGVNSTEDDLYVVLFDRGDARINDGEPLMDVDGRVQFSVVAAGNPFSFRFGADSGEPWDCRRGLCVALSTVSTATIPAFAIAQTGIEDRQIIVNVEYESPDPGENLGAEAERGEFIGRRRRRDRSR
jgi:hypothetical protein